MRTTTMSGKGQIVIPGEIRARLGLQRGDRFAVETKNDELVLRLLPRNPLLSLRGAFKGTDSLTRALREEHEAEWRSEVE